MEAQHAPDWIEASTMLRDAMEQYRDQHYYPSLPRVVDDLIDYIEQYSGKWLNEKTVKRDMGNRSDSKKLYRIPDWRVRIYAKWLYEKVGKERNWIATWLDSTAYSAPGKLLAEVSEINGDIHSMYRTIRTNVPSLKTRLWGRFLGRQEELKRLQQWANHQRHPIAVLYGFGGNGKTTIQQKVGEEFVHGVRCPLRWPYDGAVWVSAVDYLRGQPGLVDVLREIAETFDVYASLSKRELRTIPPNALKDDVTALLEKLRILVLLDNFETISKPNQIEILQFFNNVRGSSQVLISTRYRPDWFLEQENDEMYRMAHVLIRVDGLSANDANMLVHEFLNAKALPSGAIDDKDIMRLTEVTQNNPKTILVLLGLVEQGVPLAQLLDTITSGTADADRVYEMIIDHAWEELLSDDDKAVLMAKAFFNHSVSEADLGEIAGVDGDHLREAIKTLAAISFFEPERSQQQTFRIRTHPLAQDFTRRVLHDHPDFEREAEERWWTSYGPRVVQQAGQIPYESLRSDLEEDVANILEHLERHIRERSPYCGQAVALFGKDGGLGHTLRSWSRYDDVLRLAEFVLEFVIKQQDAALIGTCALHLIAPVYMKRGRLDEVDRWIGLAVEQNTRLHDRWLEAVIEISRGLLYRYQGYLRAEEQAYQKALDIFLELESTSDIVAMYQKLGHLTICLATQEFEGAIDTSGAIQAELARSESYFEQAEALLNQEKTDQNSHNIPLEHRDKRAIIARLRGDLDQARDLLQSCVGRLHSSYSVANLYRELALVEHLAGNTELAHSHEAKSTNLFRQLGLFKLSHTSCYTHCGKVIDHMKQEGTW